MNIIKLLGPWMFKFPISRDPPEGGTIQSQNEFPSGFSVSNF